MAGYCRYKRLKKQVSYDSGATWQDVSPAEYMKGDLIEADSTICGYAVYTRWVESGYTCVGYDKHAVEYEQTSNDNINWAYTQRSRTGRLLEANSEDCGYVPPTPPSSGYANQYLTFRALQDESVLGFRYNTGNTVYVSSDSGSTWIAMSSPNASFEISSGETLMFKATLTASDESGIGKFAISEYGLFEVEGNIMSLKYGDNFSGQTTLTDNYSFCQLFDGCTRLTSAENLVLPATSLTTSCYDSMFSDCSRLTTAPALPATTLAQSCYSAMFWLCTSLTTAPALPATTLAQSCYSGMFINCTSLTTAPALPATTLAQHCYDSMFYLCSSLTTAPELPATTLAEGCYQGMFSSCFQLNSITCLATDISANYCTYNWVYDVPSSGTFYKAASMSSWPTGDNGIPSGWIVLNNS